MKTCPKCLQPRTDFAVYKPRNGATYPFKFRCRDCFSQEEKEWLKQYRLAHREELIKVSREQHSRRMFGGKREVIIQRDGEKCVKCGMTRLEHRKRFKRDLAVDHIDRRGTHYPIGQKNNDPKNLQALCVICHGEKDGAYLVNGYKKLIQLTKDGEFIREWNSSREAADELGIRQMGIVNALNGNDYSYKGFRWVYPLKVQK